MCANLQLVRALCHLPAVGDLFGDRALLTGVSLGQIGSVKQIAPVDLRVLQCELVEEDLLTALPSLCVEADLNSDANDGNDDVA